MNNFWQDVRYAVRMLRKNAVTTIMAVVTLALGIGANSTVFSWANATLLDPIPGMQKPWDAYAIARGTPGHANSLSYPDLRDLQRGNQTFAGITGFGIWPLSFTEGEKPERVWGCLVTANFFDVLGVRPVLGRGFVAEEEGASGGAPVAVISYRLWERRFAKNPGIVGRAIRINKHTYTIVGVTPQEFQGSYTGLRMEVWIPMVMQEQIVPGGNLLEARGSGWMIPLGRVKPGVSREEAQASLNAQYQEIMRRYPDSHNAKDQITLYPLWRAPGANQIFSVVMPMLLAVAGLLLLLTCANVANLMVVRATARVRELALRLSLGASRIRLTRQLLVESVLLSLLGGAGALGITLWGKRTFMEMAPQSDLPIWVPVQLDQRVFLVTLGVSVVTGLIFGILPAWRAAKTDPMAALKSEASAVAGGRYKARLSRGLAVAQIALSLLLLISASLLVQSFWNTKQFQPGFNPENVLLAGYDLFPNGYELDRGIELDKQLLAKVRALPGIRSAALADWVPLGFSSSSDGFTPEGYTPQAGEVMQAGVAAISPEYLETMQIPLKGGRDFLPSDATKSQPVVIVNEALAKRYWPGQEAAGKKIRIEGKWRNVVGVAQDSHYQDLHERPTPFVYFPLYQNYHPRVTLHVRTASEPLSAFASVEAAVHEVNAELPLFDVGTLRSRMQAASTVQRVAGPATGALGALALILAAVGIYGVVSFTTQQRTQEIGIRVALGAQRPDVLRLILGEGAKFTVLGVLLGVAGAFVLMRGMSSLLFGVGAGDAATFVLIPVALSGVVLLACYVPARRAMRVDPQVALRQQ
jgi:predicted permease